MVPFDGESEKSNAGERSEFDVDVKTEAALARINNSMGGICGIRNSGMVLGMAYVPFQEFDELYDEELALKKGTLFAPLDLPFLGRRIMNDD